MEHGGPPWLEKGTRSLPTSPGYCPHGLEQKKVVVHETGNVSELAIENLSADEEVYIQSGDIVRGGKQDRTLPYGTLVGPSSGRVPVDSFCVEQGRWRQRGEEKVVLFDSSNSMLATSDLKHAARSGKHAAQSEVWGKVAQTQEKLTRKLGESVRDDESESSLQLTLEHPAVKKAIEPYLQRLCAAADGKDDVIGFVAIINGKVVSADIYASRDLFRKLWPKLLEGSATEAFIEAEEGKVFEPLDEAAVRAFLAEAEAAELADQAATARVYVQIRSAKSAVMFDSCDRSRENVVLHRSFLAK